VLYRKHAHSCAEKRGESRGFSVGFCCWLSVSLVFTRLEIKCTSVILSFPGQIYNPRVE
jgi:hypothetical protein